MKLLSVFFAAIFALVTFSAFAEEAPAKMHDEKQHEMKKDEKKHEEKKHEMKKDEKKHEEKKHEMKKEEEKHDEKK